MATGEGKPPHHALGASKMDAFTFTALIGLIALMYILAALGWPGPALIVCGFVLLALAASGTRR